MSGVSSNQKSHSGIRAGEPPQEGINVQKYLKISSREELLKAWLSQKKRKRARLPTRQEEYGESHNLTECLGGKQRFVP